MQIKVFRGCGIPGAGRPEQGRGGSASSPSLGPRAGRREGTRGGCAGRDPVCGGPGCEGVSGGTRGGGAGGREGTEGDPGTGVRGSGPGERKGPERGIWKDSPAGTSHHLSSGSGSPVHVMEVEGVGGPIGPAPPRPSSAPPRYFLAPPRPSPPLRGSLAGPAPG